MINAKEAYKESLANYNKKEKAKFKNIEKICPRLMDIVFIKIQESIDSGCMGAVLDVGEIRKLYKDIDCTNMGDYIRKNLADKGFSASYSYKTALIIISWYLGDELS